MPGKRPTSEAFVPTTSDAQSPTDFMRARRPELFSDSEVRRSSSLSKDLFDHLLNIITSRKQEIDFEHFCRRLAELEICPNLLPQTGPTGGGDSKTDSENYPVSPIIAARWYTANPEAASKQRWAFAFSAKREWRSKIRSDVSGIVDTNRGYDHIYFITNQLVKDKTRAQVEQELLKKHGVPVHIMDRSWLLKCIFEHHRQGLAIETLHLDVPSSDEKILGVRDAYRLKELEEIELRISDTSRYTGVEYQLVEECLEAAVLSRNLELPRTEVDGKFLRAQRLADSIGTAQQRLRVQYQRGWTAYWWYEDLPELVRSYGEVAPAALASDLTDDVELAVNLWQLLASACDTEKLDPSVIQLKGKADELVLHLTILAADPERKNNALWAKTHLLIIELRSRRDDAAAVTTVLTQFRQVAQQAEGLLSYPLMALARLVEEVGEFFADIPEYDSLIEEIARITQERVGRRQAGRLYSARGLQKLRTNAVYDAIRFFGKAQQNLALRETRDELAVALFSCGLAYEGAGLLWAARANTLSALSLLVADFHEDGEMSSNVLRAIQKLIWQELQLGRVPQVLQWSEFAALVAGSLGPKESERSSFIEQRESQDKVLALLFLKASREDLLALRFLPDVLERQGLLIARLALLYALGYEGKLRQEGLISAEESSDNLQELFSKFVELPESADLPARPRGLESGKVLMTSPVLGATITLIADEGFESVRLGERVLAACEALFATSLDAELLPYREELTVQVVHDRAHKGQPEITDQPGMPGTLMLRHNGDPNRSAEPSRDWFFPVIAKLLVSLVVVSSPEKYLERVFGEEAALGRALNFTASAVVIANIFGKQPKERLAAWNNAGAPEAYVLRRDSLWHGGKYTAKYSGPRVTEPKPGEGDIPEELTRQQVKHTERHLASVIDLPLWDEAHWRGVSFLVPPPEMPGEPLMGLGFEDAAAGKKIFEAWRKTLGQADKEDRIRISIITGIDERNPFAYRVIVGSNLPKVARSGKPTQFLSVSRVQRMDAQSSLNLSRFVESYKRVGAFFLLPAGLSKNLGSSEMFYQLALRKKLTRIIPAWKIGEHDMDCMGVLPEDRPIIPAEEKNAPVMKLLGSKRRH